MKRAETGSLVGSGCVHGGTEHKFISKEGKGFLLLLQASRYAHAGKHTYLGTVSGFCLRALLGNE